MTGSYIISGIGVVLSCSNSGQPNSILCATYEVTGNHTYYLQLAVHHIIICPLTNMAATLHIYVLLCCYCSLHIDPHITANISKTAAFAFHATVHVHI